MKNINRSIHICNGQIITDPTNSFIAESITIIDGTVHAHNDDLPSGIEVLDLQGKTLVPGLIDSHLHLTLGASALGHADLKKCNSRYEFEQILVQESKKIRDGRWLIASGWSEQTLSDSPDRSWIPESIVCPTICYRNDLHAAIVNSQGTEQLDLDAINKMVGGEDVLEGVFKEDALFYGLQPMVPDLSNHIKLKQSTRALQDMQSFGLTMIGTMETLDDVLNILYEIDLSTLMRIRAMCFDEPTQMAFQKCDSFCNSDFLAITGLKTFLDGTLGSRTAKLYEPWNDASGNGELTQASQTIDEWVKLVSNAQFSPVIHAIGDQAVGIALKALQNVNSSMIPRIEHAQLIHEKDINLIKGFCFGVQPLHVINDSVIAVKSLGKQRANLLHDWRRMLDAGATLSFGSDWPVAPFDPIGAMGIAIAQGVTPQEALVATTSDAAMSLRSPLAGNLTLGSFGDCVVLDANPLSIDWNTVSPKVQTTILNGSIVYNVHA